MIMVDCGFCLEADEEISFDTVAPRRNGATLAMLADADSCWPSGRPIRPEWSGWSGDG